MKTKTRIKWQVLLIALSFFSLNTLAQIGPIVNTIIPPSPTSAAFRQFAGYTPNLATGTVNIPIGLYDVQVGDFSLPISLQYYTQGIKITDDPFPAGYGWMLCPGLRITRTIMGRPDMYYPMEVRTTGGIDFDYCKKAIYDEESHKHAGWTDDKLLDTQHDIFTVHLPHGNYTFFLNKQNGVYTAVTANNHLKITPKGVTGFEVIDEQGVIYHFGTEAGLPASLPYEEIYHNRYATSWMLRKIVLPGAGREINFTWEEVRHSDLSFGPYFGGDILKDYKQEWNSYVPTDRNPEHTSAESEGLLSRYGDYEEILHLKQIAFPGGTVDFTYKSTLKPLLTDIKVKNTNAAVVKSISFSYGTGLDERLLQQISFSDEGIYRFQYNSKRFDAGNQNSQDYWGYFNGKNNNSLVPRMQVKTYNNRAPGGYASYIYYGTADRSIDSESMKAYLLTKIIYPTGGYSTFEYEPHQFQGSIPQTTGLGDASKVRLTRGGGLRVVKVTSSAGGGAPEVVKTYKYGSGESGLANVLYEPTLDTFVDELSGYTGEIVSSFSAIGYNLRSLFLNTQSNYMKYAMNTPALWYDTVTEYVGGEAKTVYTYQRLIQENVAYSLNTVLDFTYKTVSKYHNLFSKGCLLTKEINYSKSGSAYSPVKQTTYSYSVKEDLEKSINDLLVTRMGINMFTNGPDLEYSNNQLNCGQYNISGHSPDWSYLHNPLNIRFFYEELQGVNTVYYTSSGNLTEQTSYTYSANHLKSKTVIRSDGKALKETYFYPMDYANAESTAQQNILSAMLARNIQSPVYKMVRTVNGMSELERKEYKDFGSNLFLPEKHFYRKGSEQEVCKALYGYDTKGNLQTCTENGALKRTFLWGYNYTYLVAVIEGLNYVETLALAGQSNINNLNSYNWNIPSALASIRLAVASQGLMTSYTYEPLIGIASITSPNGQVNYYAYDKAGRLNKLLDNDSHVMQRFAYHRTTDSPLEVSFNTQASYGYGTNLSVTATVSGGSEYYSHVWTLKNSSNTVLYTSTPTESTLCTIPLQQSGTLTLTCTATDKLTGETKSSSRSFQVSSATVGFSNVVQSNGSVTAKIICPGECTIGFYLFTEMAGEGYAEFYLDGKKYQLYNGDGRNESMTLAAGSHNFSVSLVTPGSSNLASLNITSMSPYAIGTVSYIQVSN